MKTILVSLGIIAGCPLAFGQITNGDFITGVWRGNWSKKLGMAQPKEISVELYLYDDSLVTGVTHFSYKGGLFEHHKIGGKFQKKDSSLIFTEDNLISVRKWKTDIVCRGKYEMKFSFSKEKILMTGSWSDKRKGLFSCPSTRVWFEKVMDTSALSKTPEMDSLDDIVLLKESVKRVPDIQQIIELKSHERDSIRIDLYDNGEIDNDSVSVILDERVLLRKVMVATTPISIFLSLNGDQKIYKLKLIAENLGNIPPNTALMIVSTKQKKYEIYLTSSREKNAVVEFFIVN